jgi:hypothetical protein
MDILACLKLLLSMIKGRARPLTTHDAGQQPVLDVR